MGQIQWEHQGGGFHQGVHHDEASGQFTLCFHHDDSFISAVNRHRRLTEDNSARRRSGKLFQVAEVSNGTIMEWKHMHGVDVFNEDHWPGVMRLIHSQQYRDKVMVTESNCVRSNESVERKYFTGSLDQSSHPLSSTRRKFGGVIASGSF